MAPPFAPSESILHSTAEIYNVDLNIDQSRANEIIFIYKLVLTEISEIVYSTPLETITQPVIKIISDDILEIKDGVHKLSRIVNDQTLINAKRHLEKAQAKITAVLKVFSGTNSDDPDLLEKIYLKLVECHDPLINALDFLDAYPS